MHFCGGLMMLLNCLLIAQAISDKLTIVSADSSFSEYGVKILW